MRLSRAFWRVLFLGGLLAVLCGMALKDRGVPER